MSIDLHSAPNFKVALRSISNGTISRLPREIIDQIIIDTIHLHDADPAYQWTNLRHITRYHRQYLEQHFLRFWLPKLIISIYGCDYFHLDYRVNSVSKKSPNIAKFKATGPNIEKVSQDYSEGGWCDVIANSLFIRPNVVLRLGIGELADGYNGGWIASDCPVEGLRWTDERGFVISFDWKRTFNTLFREEIIMRQVQRKLVRTVFTVLLARTNLTAQIDIYFPGRKYHLPWHELREEDRLILVKTLKSRIQLQRHAIMRCYRSHAYFNREGPVKVPDDYWQTNFRPRIPDNDLRDLPLSIEEIVRFEESVVFRIKGWEDLSVEELWQLRQVEYVWMASWWEDEALFEELIWWRDMRPATSEEMLKELKRYGRFDGMSS